MSPDDLCRLIKWTSAYVRLWITRQPEVKEESISDWSLDWLSSTSGVLAYQQFTRHEEGRTTGADWEWWIVGRTRSFKARVQAKRLKATEDNHPSLSYSNENGSQILKLIASAEARRAAPIYMFYAASFHPVARGFAPNGMFVADAYEIDRLFVSPARRVVTQEDVLERCIPLPTLFCSPEETEPTTDVSNAIAKFIWAEREPAEAEIQELEFDEPYIHAGVPSNVEAFLRSTREVDVRLSNAWFADSFPGVEAVFVIDLRTTE